MVCVCRGESTTTLCFPLFQNTPNSTYAWVPDAILHKNGGCSLSEHYTANWAKSVCLGGGQGYKHIYYVLLSKGPCCVLNNTSYWHTTHFLSKALTQSKSPRWSSQSGICSQEVVYLTVTFNSLQPTANNTPQVLTAGAHELPMAASIDACAVQAHVHHRLVCSCQSSLYFE